MSERQKEAGPGMPVAEVLRSTDLVSYQEGSVVSRTLLEKQSGTLTLFAFAESVICTERLPAALRSGLLSGGLSLGQLLLLPGFESRREGLWYGRERSGLLPPAVAALTEPDFLTRTYRVSAGSRPLMLITERFPWAFRG